MEHFIIKCKKLEWFRRKELLGEGEGRIILARFLFDRGKMGEVKDMLGKMWRERRYWLRVREFREISERRGNR